MEGLAQAPVTHQAPGSRVDGGEGEVGALDLPHGAGLQPVVRGHGAVRPDVRAWAGQHQGLQWVEGTWKRGSRVSESRLRVGGWEVRKMGKDRGTDTPPTIIQRQGGGNGIREEMKDRETGS